MASELLYQRDVYGKTLVELGKQDENIVVLDADLSGSTRTVLFAREFPERFFNFGIAEQNMMATAAGLASCGKKVFASTFAMFATGRAWDQVRNSICYSDMNVKIVATHAGITVGPDGATHQALEDIALMRVIPNMRVIVPCDGPQTRDAVIAAANIPGPVYVRLGRSKIATIENKGTFTFGKAEILTKGTDIAIFSCGIMTKIALDALALLSQEGISCSLINIHTIKPLDVLAVEESAKDKKGIIVCEEHSTTGGLGCAVSEVLSRLGMGVAMLRIGVRNKFGQSGDHDELLKKYNLSTEDIVTAAKKLLLKK
ncbi:MAG: transketolase family protein [Candidatus Omnitrophica bacterium]|nr:transketolase family protein [Candidatus Omnitrophota bacterium]